LRVYLDHNATTPPDPRVEAAMAAHSRERFGNPSSLHSFGREARAAVERARAQVAAAVGARAEEVVFTSGGTEANALALQGLARARPGRRGHVLAGATEHPSVLETLAALREEGFETGIVPVDRDGIVHSGAVEERLRPDTFLVSVMAVNNETGTIQPCAEIARTIRRRSGIAFHVDAAQALGRLRLDRDGLGADLLTLSAHKAHGPLGVGALCAREGLALAPLQRGGGQERGVRSGTENAAGAVGFGVAAELAAVELDERVRRVAELSRAFLDGARRVAPGVERNGAGVAALPHTLCLRFPEVRGESLLVGLDLEGVAASLGSACASGSPGPSPVLLAMGFSEEEARASLRFGFAHTNTLGDIAFALAALEKTLERVRRPSRTR
jgi:cysteine desulfurase